MPNLKPWFFAITPLFISLILWIIAKVDSGMAPSFSASINQLSAMFGLVFFTQIMIISTRLKFLEYIFGSYDKTYFWHKFFGISGFLLVLVHFIMVLLSLDSLNNTFSYIFDISNIGVFLGTISFFGILFLLVLTYISSLPYHIWKMTHEWMGLFFILGGLHSLMMAPETAGYSLLKMFFFIFGGIGLISFLYIRFFWKYFGQKSTYTIAKIETSNTITDVYLEPTENSISYEPGQFVFASFLDNQYISSEPHPFTISSSPEDEFLRLSVKKLGNSTNKISSLKAGQTVSINGPYGNFFEKAILDNTPLTFIAGGIGITPFLSFSRAKDMDYRAKAYDLFYLTKNPQEAIYNNEINQNLSPISRFFNFNSDLTKRHFGVQDLQQIYGSKLNERYYYICGPKAMMDSMIDGLLEVGVSKKRIFVEDFSFK